MYAVKHKIMNIPETATLLKNEPASPVCSYTMPSSCLFSRGTRYPKSCLYYSIALFKHRSITYTHIFAPTIQYLVYFFLYIINMV